MCVLSMAACHGNQMQVDETNQLARDIEAQYHHPARVELTPSREMNVYLQGGAVDPKFSQEDCDDYAQRVARFAMNHYAKSSSVEYVYVYVQLTQPGNPPGVRWCEGNGNHGALPPDNETPSFLKGAGAGHH